MDTASEPDQGTALTWPPAHKSFNKILRLGRSVTVTEKLDGTNALVAIHPDPSQPLAIGSRNRWISPGKGTDNYGFAQWVLDNEEAIRRLGPGWHYGEWWGVGIGPRKYPIAERRWYLFDTRWTAEELLARGLPANVGVVPVLTTREAYSVAVIEGTADDPVAQAIKKLRQGSVACPGFMNPEGVVVSYDGGTIRRKYIFEGETPKVKTEHDVPHA